MRQNRPVVGRTDADVPQPMLPTYRCVSNTHFALPFKYKEVGPSVMWQHGLKALKEFPSSGGGTCCHSTPLMQYWWTSFVQFEVWTEVKF